MKTYTVKTRQGRVYSAASLEMAIHEAKPRHILDITEAVFDEPHYSMYHPVSNVDLLRELCNYFSVWPNPPLPRY